MLDDIEQAVVDSSPLIYLAKLDALDVFAKASLRALVPRGVVNEVTTPALAYRYPDAVTIKEAIANGVVTMVELTDDESLAVRSLRAQQSGLGVGEAEVIAIAASRGFPALVVDHRGRVVAGAMGVRVIDTVELLVAGTLSHDQLSDRIRRFASLVNMRLADYEALRQTIEQRRLR